MNYKAVIFDVGDTLLEHYPSQIQIYTMRMEELGFTINTQTTDKISLALAKSAHDQIGKEQNGAPRMSDEDFEVMLDKAALSCIDKNYNEYDETACLEKLKNIPIPKQELRVIPGTLETLEFLKEKKFRLGIISNHYSWLPDYLKEIGLAEYFEVIVVSGIVGVEKPDIRIMQIALEKFSLPAESCLYVGDHPFDVFCAKKAGMDCAWITASDSVLPDSVLPYKEDFRLNKLSDLIDIFEMFLKT